MAEHLGVPRTISGDRSLHVGDLHPRIFCASAAREYGLSPAVDGLFGQPVADLHDTALANKSAQRKASGLVPREVRL
jgi:hypothetical protein